MDSNNSQHKARVLAFYLPQFHPIPENDEWWGKGFTEWTNVGKAKPLFPGHYQPKVPADLGYYDLRVPETRVAQAELAKEYGIEGFVYWHYWFGNGKRLLERPFQEVLESGEPDFPFALAWANESWKGFYHGVSGRNVLIEQKYGGREDYIEHFNSILPAFKDKRYIQVDGKPLFMIYHPFEMPDVQYLISLWRELAERNGLPGIYFVAISYDNSQNKKLLKVGFDGINTNHFLDYQKYKRSLVHSIKAKLLKFLYHCPNFLFYDDVVKYFIAEEEYKENIFPTLLPNWDHSPRTGKTGLIIWDSSPEKFAESLCDVKDAIKDKSSDKSLIFIKSWNEWAEGNYLEPDIKYGRRYLEVIKEKLSI